jgi:hypothetical protein
MLQAGYGDERQFRSNGTYTWPRAAARKYFFHDCAKSVAERALDTLRPQGTLPVEETTPLKAWPLVPTTIVVASADRALSPEWGVRSARERLGISALRLRGGHTPQLARPGALSTLIKHALART